VTRRKDYGEVNLRLGYRSDRRWEAVIYVQNLLNERYWQGVENGGDLTPASQWSPAQPRNIGVDLRWRFGAGSGR
jgi:iron complex outermembrane receptor protein